MRIVFARNNTVISYVIRLVTWSHWSHCAIIYGDMVIEAVGGKGVVLTPFESFKNRYTDITFGTMATDCTEEEAIQRALAEIGKGYDRGALFGILFRTDWDCPDSWFCSELIAHSSGIFRNDRLHRITPEMIYMVCK